jgi:hypothetical protein
VTGVVPWLSSVRTQAEGTRAMTSITAERRAWVPTTVTAAIFMALLVLTALMPEVCPAIAPAPPSCSTDARESAAMTGGLVVLATAAVGIALIYLLPVGSRPLVLRLAMIAVTLAGVIALLSTVVASGFLLI